VGRAFDARPATPSGAAHLLTKETDVPQWDVRQPIVGSSRQVDGRIGVSIDEPYFSHGYNRVMVEINTEMPVVRTTTARRWCSVDDTKQEAEQAVRDTLGSLDRLITELSQHRHRLAADLASLAGRDFARQASSRDGFDPIPIKPQPPAVVDVSLPPAD
jgi:hypothetical protein